MRSSSDVRAPVLEAGPCSSHDPAPGRAAGAVARREISAALDAADLDATLARYVRRARAEDVPVAQVRAEVEQMVARGFQTRSTDADRAQAMAAVVRRAVARYSRDD
jgi:hypothetical protein